MFKRIGLLSLFACVMATNSASAVVSIFVPESMWQKSKNEQKILDYISAQGSSINVAHRYLDSKTGVHHAAIKGYSKLLKFFLDNGCAVDDLDRKKYSPLLYAVLHGQNACIAILIEKGADLTQLTPKKASLADLAKQNDYNVLSICIQRFLDSEWDLSFLVDFLRHFRSEKTCSDFSGSHIIFMKNGITGDQLHKYMTALLDFKVNMKIDVII